MLAKPLLLRKGLVCFRLDEPRVRVDFQQAGLQLRDLRWSQVLGSSVTLDDPLALSVVVGLYLADLVENLVMVGFCAGFTLGEALFEKPDDFAV